MDLIWYRCNIQYYLREKCFGKVKKIVKKALSQYADTMDFVFYYGVANALEGQVQNAINDLTPIQSDKNLQLGVLIAIIYCYKFINTLEKENLYNLESKLKEERKQASAVSLYYAGLFLSLAEKYDKAADYINKSLRKDSNNMDTIILKAWNEMFMNVGKIPTSCLDSFEIAFNKSDKNVAALLGMAKYECFAKNHDASNLILDRLIVSSPGQVVPLVEKLRNEFAMQKWDAVYDTIERIFSQDPDNIESLKIQVFVVLCKDSDHIEAVDQLNRFFTILENNETHNGFQFFNTAQIFSRVCGRSGAVLSQVYRFAQYASEMYPNNLNYLSEVGYQCILQGKFKDAQNFFKAASKIDSNSITALCGLTLCQMFENGPIDQIAQQIELLFEMQGNEKIPILYLLAAQLKSKNSNGLSLLNEAFSAQILNATQFPLSLMYVKNLDPDFMLQIYNEYKKHLPKKPFVIISYLLYSQEENSSLISNCFKLLDTTCHACPGLIPALFELAKLKFLCGYANEAQTLAHQITGLDNTHAGSQVLLAQIYIQQQDYAKAAQYLEMCLSYNFKVRDSAMYHFLNGIILKNHNQLQDALLSYNTSHQILTSKSIVSNANRSYESDLNVIDKASLYLQIIEVQTSLSQFGEAEKTMQVTSNNIFFIHL